MFKWTTDLDVTILAGKLGAKIASVTSQGSHCVLCTCGKVSQSQLRLWQHGSRLSLCNSWSCFRVICYSLCSCRSLGTLLMGSQIATVPESLFVQVMYIASTLLFLSALYLAPFSMWVGEWQKYIVPSQTFTFHITIRLLVPTSVLT